MNSMTLLSDLKTEPKSIGKKLDKLCWELTKNNLTKKIFSKILPIWIKENNSKDTWEVKNLKNNTTNTKKIKFNNITNTTINNKCTPNLNTNNTNKTPKDTKNLTTVNSNTKEKCNNNLDNIIIITEEVTKRDPITTITKDKITTTTEEVKNLTKKGTINKDNTTDSSREMIINNKNNNRSELCMIWLEADLQQLTLLFELLTNLLSRS